MSTTITIGDGLLLLIGLCVVLVLVYVIRILRAFLPTVKALTAILEDTQKVTGVVSEATTGVEDAVSSLTDSAGDMADFINNNQSSFKAIVCLVNAVAAIRQLLS